MDIKNTRYSYKPFINRVYWVAFWALIIAEAIILRMHIDEILKADWADAILKGLLASTVVISLFYRLFFHIRPRVFSKYSITGDEIHIWQGSRCKKFKFSQVEKLRLTFLPTQYGGGFVATLNTGQKFMFSTLLDGFAEFLLAFTQNVKSEITQDQLNKVLSNYTYLPLLWEHMQLKLKRWPVVLIKWLLLPLLFTVVKFNLSVLEDYSFVTYLTVFFTSGTIIGVLLNILELKVLLFLSCKYKWQELQSKVHAVLFWSFSTIHLAALILVFGCF